MGRRGPAPAPTADRLLRGESRPSRVNYDEPVLDAPRSMKPPSGLQGAGLQEWKRQITHLTDRGVLADSDLTGFEDYCRALSELRRFEAKAKSLGTEQAIQRGVQKAVVALRGQTNTLRQQCGLTPASRSGVKASATKKASSVSQFRLAKGSGA